MKTCPRCGYKPSGNLRSDPQNKYYWGCVVQILSDELGYTLDEIHEMLKRKFLKVIFTVKNKRTGDIEFIENTKSTSSLDTKEWEEFMTKVREWSSINLDIFIPEPNEVIE